MIFTEGSDDDGSTFKKTYWVSTHFKGFWNEALNICHSFGMQFASLETSKEAKNFLQLCDKKNNLCEHDIHIGGLTTVGKSRTDWYWVDSGNKVTYDLKFGANEPNNAHGNEMCLALIVNSENVVFNDVPCYGETSFKFICQSKSSVQRTRPSIILVLLFLTVFFSTKRF